MGTSQNDTISFPRILSFKPNNFMDYLLLSTHLQMQHDFYTRLVSKRTALYPIKVLFSEFILTEKVQMPFGGRMANNDIVFLRMFLALNQTRVLKFGRVLMDQKFMKAMYDQENALKFLKVCHLGLLGNTFWLSQFLSRYLKSSFLEEIGWAVDQHIAKIDMTLFLQNCPQVHKLYLDMMRTDIKNIPLNELIQVSVIFGERMKCLNIRQKRTKIMMDANFMLNSKFKYFRVDAERDYCWYEKEKLPKPVIYVDLKNVHIDRNHVDKFEWQLKMSKNLQEVHLKTNVAYLRLAELSHLRLIEIDLGHPTNVLSVINCPSLLSIDIKNLMIID